MIHITSRINMVEVVWVVVATFGLFYGLRVRHDALLDVRARHVAKINSGREEIARLLMVTTSLSTYAFSVWLICGGLAMLIPSATTSPIGYMIQAGLVSAEVAIAYSLYYMQKVRRRVLLRDMNSAEIRKRAAADLDSLERKAQTAASVAQTAATEAQTAATQAQTAATEAATHALQNGPMQAQIAQTEATTELTSATSENTEVIKISTEVELKKLDEDKHG